MSEAESVHKFGKMILEDLAPDLESVKALLQMFPEGFFQLELEQQNDLGALEWVPVGLISSVLWDTHYLPDFSKLEKTVAHTHSSGGKIMHIHTLGVLPEQRRKGIGRVLMGSELNLAALLNLEKISVISQGTTVKFFEVQGFSIVRPVSEFIPFHQDKFPQPMLMELILERLSG
jgi:ribosomal protein S18 acetylase RimI-like enzyme